MKIENNLHIKIIKAQENDLSDILNLQYIAYKSEAQLFNDFNIPPLTQTLANIKDEFNKGTILKAVNNKNDLLGSVRAFSHRNTLHIGKLFVHPNNQKQGIGSQLLHSIEQLLPHQRYELFTSSKSIRNINFYTSLGYRVFKTNNISDELTLIFLEKCI